MYKTSQPSRNQFLPRHELIMQTMLILFGIGFSFSCIVYAKNDASTSIEKIDVSSDDALVNHYISSKGKDIIVFDADNIKQFWIDNSVYAQKDAFHISLKTKDNRSFQSVPLKLHLKNVNEAQDCSVEVLSNNPDLTFSIHNQKQKEISDSNSSERFINYTILKSKFHLEDTEKMSFDIKFNSADSADVSIKAIILSFSPNPNSRYLLSPGTKRIARDDFSQQQSSIKEIDSNSFSVNGKWISLVPNCNFFVSDHPISYSVKVKNQGDSPVAVYLRYVFYSKDHVELGYENFPYSSNTKALSVISAEKGTSSIVVDNYCEWAKGCYIAKQSKDDMPEIPFFSFLDGKVSEFKQRSDGHAEIILDKAIEEDISEGDKLRIAGTYYHRGVKSPANRIPAGEEKGFALTINKKNKSFLYSINEIPEGVYYIKPMIIIASYSEEPFSVSFSDFFVTY